MAEAMSEVEQQQLEQSNEAGVLTGKIKLLLEEVRQEDLQVMDRTNKLKNPQRKSSLIMPWKLKPKVWGGFSWKR